jgi:hypothetical protein
MLALGFLIGAWFVILLEAGIALAAIWFNRPERRQQHLDREAAQYLIDESALLLSVRQDLGDA